ncbi:MAG: hypothetical protein WCN64_01375, partial [Planctomycetota bacterium]
DGCWMPTLVCFGREEEPTIMLLLICLKGKQNPLLIILSPRETVSAKIRTFGRVLIQAFK